MLRPLVPPSLPVNPSPSAPPSPLPDPSTLSAPDRLTWDRLIGRISTLSGEKHAQALKLLAVWWKGREMPTLKSAQIPASDPLTLQAFIAQAWSIVEPSTPLAWNWHLDVLCDLLTQVTQGAIKRLIVNVPPGTGKSLLISVFWPAWEWSLDPSLRHIIASYSDENPIRDNLKLRTIVQSLWYQRAFPHVRLSSDQAAKVRFDTTARGFRLATSVGGAGTGEHPDRINIDDPLKAKAVRSAAKLEECNEWFDGTIATRIARDPAIVLVMQRLHLADLTAHLLARAGRRTPENPSGWELVCFPMRFDPARADPRDIRTVPDQLLWPERWTEEKVRAEEIALGPYGSAAQLSQNPVPAGGGLIKREWFTFVEAAPVSARRCRGWDTADTPEMDTKTRRKGDWTVGVRLSHDEATGRWYVEHAVRARTGPDGVDSLIRNTAATDGRDCLIREGAMSGKATILARSKTLAGYDFAAMPETEDKISRAGPLRAQCEAGNVCIVIGDWNEAYLDVLTSFPVGKYDDDVDATSNAFNGLLAVDANYPDYAVW